LRRRRCECRAFASAQQAQRAIAQRSAAVRSRLQMFFALLMKRERATSPAHARQPPPSVRARRYR